MSGPSRGTQGSASVLVLTNIPNHYRIPLFNELVRQLIEIDAELKVVFAAESYQRRRRSGRHTKLEDAEFDWEILPSLLVGRNRPLFLPRGLTKVVEARRPSLIIVAGTGSLALAVSRLAKRYSIPWLVWSGEVGRGSRFVMRLKRTYKKRLLKQAAASICYGTASADFVKSLAPDTPVFLAWNTSNLGPFLAIDRRSPRPPGDRIRIVCVGDLVEIKGYAFILKALALLDMDLKERVELAIVGEGPQRDELRSLAQACGVQDLLSLLGALSADDVPEVLAACDVFVFPSLGDVWGLALVEAMASGLPVIASSRAGATRDLVVPGTGMVVDPTDVEGLAAALASMIQLSSAERHQIGLRARAHVAKLCSLENSAAGFVQAIKQSLVSAAG